MEKTAYPIANYAPPPGEGSILQLPIEQIFTEKGLNKGLKRNESIRLAQNIRKYGISTPVVVTPIEVFPGFYRYCVQKGAEIWHAAGIAGIKTLPCVIENAPPKDPEVAKILAEIRQGSLHVLDQASAIRYLIEKHALGRAEIAKETGFSPSAIANKLRLCRLSPAEQQEIRRTGLSERHARAILRLSEPEKRLAALRTIAQQGMSVAAAESLVEGMLAQTADISSSNSTAPQEKTDTEALVSRKIPAVKPVTGSICPKKFALHTLQPLYNSIERTLSIFRKTGRPAEMQTKEGSNEVLITIRIPTTTA